jgi:N-methylhydantoinase A/oxoprolinase/acetone carboxylase beta subunit
VLRQAGTAPSAIGAVMIGTTHFTNAFVQARSLVRVGAIRLAAPAATSLPPFTDWPTALDREVRGHVAVARGGYNYDGSEISAVRPAEIREIAEAMRAAGIRAVAISSVFASVNDEQERLARGIVHDVMPEAVVTLSSSLGRLGLLERENAAIMNASLAGMAAGVVRSFRTALESIGIRAQFFVSQNDGTLMAPDLAARFPVLTFASGPTNSIRGGGLLSGLDDCIVVDIGGTTTDVGVLAGGFPRESSVAVDIGGVRTNFRMPDVLSIGLGGGSRVREVNGTTTVGPDSVGFRLTSEALVFGGSTLTATDVAVAAGRAQVGAAGRVESLSRGQVDSALHCMRGLLEDAIDRMKTSATDVPVVLVGGGSILAHRDIRGASQIVVPEQAGVANAIGAAIAQVSGEVDQVYSYDALGREGALAEARRLAGERAVAAGARASDVRIVDIEELPLLYLPGGSVRVRVKAVGSLAALGGN